MNNQIRTILLGLGATISLHASADLINFDNVINNNYYHSGYHSPLGYNVSAMKCYSSTVSQCLEQNGAFPGNYFLSGSPGKTSYWHANEQFLGLNTLSNNPKVIISSDSADEMITLNGISLGHKNRGTASPVNVQITGIDKTGNPSVSVIIAATGQLSPYVFAGFENLKAFVLSADQPLIFDNIDLEKTSAPTLDCAGFMSPMDIQGVKARKNRVLSFKAKLSDAQGNAVDAGKIETPPVLSVSYISTDTSHSTEVETLSPGSADLGNQFRYDNNVWRFNLTTKGFTAKGKYKAVMKSGDEKEYLLGSACIASFVIR